ncbi:NADH dehydrogenase C1, chloroplastic/mitochondrial [Apostasia shenzhenica]|uniref:NADH dehydrogenase C1, chloroplastic/mitochondrial n=1 Tax=Apostasia shenzhenica TaxID=1088818 RepID=A0A2I0AIV0_9ASPA|nr:NADH dehydrogenase C1, chloroplastic/mitochondrial [Apostasia shenzhenica]
MAAKFLPAAAWRFPLVGGNHLYRPTATVRAVNRRGSTLARSSVTGTAGGFFRQNQGSFCSFSLRSKKVNGFVCYTSEGETEQKMYRWPNTEKPRVCILGGGFGGLYTALRLESLLWPDDKRPQVLLVDQSDKFVFKPMLYELLSGEVDSWEIAPPFTELLKNTSVQFVKDRVKLLRPSDHMGDSRINGPGKSCSGGVVLLESGLVVEYDWLVLALGAAAKLDAVPGSAEFAYPFSTLEDALAIAVAFQDVCLIELAVILDARNKLACRSSSIIHTRNSSASLLPDEKNSRIGNFDLELTFLKVDDNLRILERRRFGKDRSPISVAIVGCGYSGVELAATISERLQDKGIVQAINVETTICPTAPPGNREAALKILSSRNTKLFLGYFVSCIRETLSATDSDREMSIEQKPHANEAKSKKYLLELKPAERGLQTQILETDIVLWTVGSKPLIPELELSDHRHLMPLNGRGQAEIDETLRVRGHPRIFAIGDSAAMRNSSGRLLPATAQVAFQQADFAGWNLWAAINDRPLLPFRFQNLGEMMTLGRNDAAISPSFIEGLTLDGPVGHTARKLAYLWRMPTDEHRLKVGISWLTKSAVDSIAFLQTTAVKVFSSS